VAFSSARSDLLDSGAPVPSFHDGMAAFRGRGRRTLLVRNHEVEPEDVEEEGATPVPTAGAPTYDPNGTGGTTTLVIDLQRGLESHAVSLAGTLNNCAGGPTENDVPCTRFRVAGERAAVATMRRPRRAVAQFGSALDWGSRGRRFKSCQPDQREAL
jgi:secreted PhoX family phosphatase